MNGKDIREDILHALHMALEWGYPVVLETRDNVYDADIISLDEEHVLFSAWNIVKAQVREYRVLYDDVLSVRDE